jgi:hypothetical protein
MSLYRETPSGAAQKAYMKVETLAPMALMNFRPVAAPAVAAPAVDQPPCSQRSLTK